MPINRVSQRNDPGADSSLQGYAGHYCAVPRRREPGIVACTFILSGLRIFDIRDPRRPREVAYFNAPHHDGLTNAALSGPAFAPERREVWYSDGSHGFFAVRITNGAWTGPTTRTTPPPPKTAAGTALSGAIGIPALQSATDALAQRARTMLAASGGESTAYICFL